MSVVREYTLTYTKGDCSRLHVFAEFRKTPDSWEVREIYTLVASEREIHSRENSNALEDLGETQP